MCVEDGILCLLPSVTKSVFPYSSSGRKYVIGSVWCECISILCKHHLNKVASFQEKDFSLVVGLAVVWFYLRMSTWYNAMQFRYTHSCTYLEKWCFLCYHIMLLLLIESLGCKLNVCLLDCLLIRLIS